MRLTEGFTMMKRLVCILSVVAIVPLAVAGRQVSETRDAAPGGEVSVELISGSVEFVGWDRDVVEVTGTLGDDVEKLEIESHRDEISIEVVLPRGEHRSMHDADADLVVRLPRGSTVVAESVSADLSFDELTGAIQAESVSGELTIEGSVAEVEASTVSGGIDVRSDAALREGSFESVSGGIDFRAPLSPDGDFSFETVSGSIKLRLPGGTSADFDVETFSGKIDNELGPPAEKTSDLVPGASLRFTLGGGQADVEIESFSGRIEILRD